MIVNNKYIDEDFYYHGVRKLLKHGTIEKSELSDSCLLLQS